MARAKRSFFLYDGRAAGGDTDDAIIFVIEDSNRAARQEATEGGYGACCCYSYRMSAGEAVDERWEWNWTPEHGFSDKETPNG